MADIAAFPENDELDRNLVRSALSEAKPALAEISLSQVVKSQFQRLETAAATAKSAELQILVRELHNNIHVELSSAWFLMIPADRRELYEQKQGFIFGERVNTRFPDASKDIAAAARCFALDEWTACVFHLMRVLEHGLRRLGETVELDPANMLVENWKNIIDQIEKKIRALEELPKSTEKISKLQIYSEAASQFRYFKDAWRNYISHSRENYDEREAEGIYRHVKEFMQHLAAKC